MKKIFVTSIPVFLVALMTLGAVEVDEKEVKQVAEGNNAFAINFYQRAAEGTDNLIFSPFSIESAFGMVYAGARGETAAEMAKVLHFSLGQKKFHVALGALSRGLNERGAGGKYELSVANRLWGQQGYKFLDSYLALVKDNYGAGFETVNFGDSEAARKLINGWVEEQTKDKIKEIIPEGLLSGDIRLVLTNAIYFKGRWEIPFEKILTRDQDFTLVSGEKVKVPMMSQGDEYKVAELPACRLLELDYEGGELSMVILLPREVNGITDLGKNLTAAKLDAWLSTVHREKIDVYLPRFKVETSIDLKKKLIEMGMKVAFTFGEADLSGMDGGRSLFISDALHKAFIEVNEEGTEAAASTVVSIAVGGASVPKVFYVDHPFIFLIRDKKSGAILFIGRVMDPR